MSKRTEPRQVDEQIPSSSSISSRIRPTRRGVLGLLVCLAIAVVALALFGREESESAPSEHVGPAVVEHVEGDDLSRIVLTSHAAERLGLETTPVRATPRGLVIPYSALIYTPQGETWAYTSPARLVFLRAPIEVERIEGDLAYLSDGPPAGTKVVAVGGAELYGTEFELGH